MEASGAETRGKDREGEVAENGDEEQQEQKQPPRPEDRKDEQQEEHGKRLPHLLSSRPWPARIVVAGVVPALFGALCGWVLGVNETAYLILTIPVAILGGFVAGMEHNDGKAGALRGFISGAIFGGSILLVNELIGEEPKAHLPEPPIILAAVTAVVGAVLGAVGAGVRSDAEKGPFLQPSRLTISEFVGMLSALVLAGSLWLNWFATSGNPNSTIGTGPKQVAGPNSEATAREVFTILDWTLLLGCTAPFILAWIVMRNHDLNWRPGEVTMVVGMTAFVLILCNGIILGKPEPGIEISLAVGWFVGLAGATGLMIGGFLRQALHTDAKKPPGVL